MKLEIDDEVLDQITKLRLRSDLKLMRSELKLARKDKKHAEFIGVEDYKEYIKAIKILQKWYGA